MIWNTPAALWGLLLVAGPVLVHLFVRRHATRVVFPAMRFVPAVRAAAVRLRAPSDLALLMLRVAIVAAAVCATARPVLETAARERAWQARVARAVILDTSPSVPAEVATKLADGAASGVFVSHRFASSDLRDAIRRATEWLETAPAAEREIAIVSDFQRGSIDEADVAAVPATTGIAIVRAGQTHAAKAAVSSDGWRGGRWEAGLTLDRASTQVTWTRTGASTPIGLTVRAGEDDRAAAERAADAARSPGVSASERSRSIDVSFSGADAVVDTPPATPWIASAAMALRGSALLAETGTGVMVGERDGVMTVKTSLSARSPFAPAVIRAVLLAAAPPLIDPEAETASMDEATLTRLVRNRQPISSPRPLSDESDGRWLWALALGLVIIEGLVRRRGAAVREQEPYADAA